MLRRVALVTTDVSEERVTYRFLDTANVAPSWPILLTLMIEAICSFERQFLQQPHGVTSQNTVFFIVNNFIRKFLLAKYSMQLYRQLQL
jgi:hypothetical protein